ncbi:MAG: two-component regulator propeller domain-containing protein [Longimicrobiaceae bacterium]
MSLLPLAARFALAMGAALCVATRAGAQGAPGFATAEWNTENGLPSNAVRDIRQTADGFLWLASYEGLVRFDGVAFRSYGEAEIPGLQRASFRRLAVDRRGALWAAGETDGVVRRANGRWRVFTTRDGLASDRVTALAPAPDGSIWVGTRAGISRIAGDRVERVALPAGEPQPAVTALALDGGGGLWIGTVAGGLLHLRDGALTRITRREGLGDDRVTSLRLGRDGALWVGTFAGVARVRYGRVTRPGAESAVVPSPVNDLLQDADGDWWLAADNGLFRLRGDRIEPVTLPDGSALVQVDGLFTDREGNLWIGSRQAGLLRLRAAAVRMLTPREGLPHAFVTAVAGDGKGGEWIATRGGVVHRAADGTLGPRYARPTLRDDVVRDVRVDRRGDLWVATNSGLAWLSGGRAVTFTVRDGLPDDRIRALEEDHAGGLWIGTYNGLARMAGGTITRFGPETGLTDPYVLAIHEDRRGNLWVATQSAGLFRQEGGRFVPGPAALAGQPVFRLTDDADGTVWAGTSRGLARIRGGRVSVFTTRHGLRGNTVFQALDDGAGALWLTGPWGVARVARQELEAVAAGRARLVSPKNFGRSDGLAVSEVSSIGGAWRGADGVLYFPTPAGVALIDPRTLTRNAVPVVPQVERVVADDVEFAEGEPVDVPPGRHRLEVWFTAPSFVSPENLRFRYQLQGFDRGWTDGGTRRAAFYTNLPPGRYTFRVQARNEDGVWSTAAGTVPIRLRPHFWQTRWFAVLAVLAVAAAILALHRVRVRAAELASREEVLRAMSLRDELTGLYNRRGLLAAAEHTIEECARLRVGFGVLFIDIDGLKAINDAHGHAVGDQVLRDAAALLRATFRKTDAVARLGGDEFAVLLVGRGADGIGRTGVDAAMGRLHEAFERHAHGSRRPYALAASIGASHFDPTDPQPLEALLERADHEMYATKRLRAGRIQA